jgi:hypothetical protein
MCTGSSQGLTRAWALTWRFGGLNHATCYGVIGGPSVEDRVSTSHARIDDMTQSPQSDWRDSREHESRRGLSSSSSLSLLSFFSLSALSRTTAAAASFAGAACLRRALVHEVLRSPSSPKVPLHF